MEQHPAHEIARTVGMVVRHPPYEGSDRMAGHVLDELRDRYRRGLLSGVQFDSLERMLLESPHLDGTANRIRD